MFSYLSIRQKQKKVEEIFLSLFLIFRLCGVKYIISYFNNFLFLFFFPQKKKKKKLKLQQLAFYCGCVWCYLIKNKMPISPRFTKCCSVHRKKKTENWNKIDLALLLTDRQLCTNSCSLSLATSRYCIKNN